MAPGSSANGSFLRFVGLGLDGGPDSSLRGAFLSRAFLEALAGAHRKEVGALVDEDVVAGDLVAATVHARVVKQLDGLLAVVDLDTQGFAVHPAALLLAFLGVLLLLEAHRRAGGRGRLVTLGVLAHHDSVGAHRDRALGEHDVPLENVHAPRLVGAHPVGLDLRRLVLVALLGPGRQGHHHKRQVEKEPHFLGSNRATTSAMSWNSCDSLLYSMPRPLIERLSSVIVTSRSVRTSERSRRICRKLVVRRASGFSSSASRTSTTSS